MAARHPRKNENGCSIVYEVISAAEGRFVIGACKPERNWTRTS